MKKRILSILLLCCMVLTLLPTTVSAADGLMNTIPKYDVSIDVYNRTSDISIKDSRSYYIYSSVPDKLRDTWAWDKKIFIKGDKAAPHVFIDGVNIEMSPSSKGPAIELRQHRTIAEASAVESPIRQETIGFPAHFFARAHNFKPPGRACQPEADSPMRT